MGIKSFIYTLALFFLVFIPGIIGYYTDYLWFGEVGYLGVFMTILKARVGLGFLGFIFTFSVIYLNVRIAITKSLKARNEAPEGVKLTGLSVAIIAAFSLLMGLGIGLMWDTVFMYLNRVPFGMTDPVFGKDIGFYFFVLPFYSSIQSIVQVTLIATLVGTGAIYALYGGALVRDHATDDEFSQGSFVHLEMPKLNWTAISHLLIILGTLFMVVAVGYLLDRYSILFSSIGTAVTGGAGYTDITILLPLFSIKAALALLTGLLFIVAARTQGLILPVGAITLLIVASILGGSSAALIQQYKVSPDEFNLEKPYLEDSIRLTRIAYGLDAIEERAFPAVSNLTTADLETNRQTLENIRLWDWRPLKDTYKQLQLIRPYYEFNDVDVDRYNIDGEYRQVMLSPRELDVNQIPGKTWVNEHMVFTHGYGLAMSPVREVSREGLPDFYIKDIPPKSEEFQIDEAGIYFGELANDYLLVGTTNEELDFPKGEENVYTTYSGNGGISLSSGFTKLVMSVRFNTMKLLVSEAITKDSRIMFNRNIKDRVRTIAPFLTYDSDPYVVLSEGRIYWMMDAYTTSRRFPYSESFGRLNYIRNPVKVVIDAYHGDVTFYVIDEEPIIKTYMGIFPDLFKPISEMSDDMRSHLRYPEDLFTLQAEKYATYHMTNPRTFYGREDVYVVPQEVYERDRIAMEPYYLITKLPGEDKEEFILLLPFTPKNKNNLIAWMAARMDGDSYGERIVYVFPKDKNIFGPIQIESRIDQDPDISQLFTLWGQAGSRVIRGNLLVIPIEDSLLYVEPIYLMADREGALPELKRVIVSFGDQIAMGETLEESLTKIFGEGEIERPSIPATDGTEELPSGTADLIQRAIDHYDTAQEYLKDGNWAGYGEEIDAMRNALEELKRRS